MKKFTFKSLLTILVSVLLFSAAQARTLSYSADGPPSDSGINRALRWWVGELESRTDLNVKIHWMGSLVKLKDAVDGISAGVADMGVVIPAYSASQMPLHFLAHSGLGSGNQYITGEAWSRMYDKFPELKAELDDNNMVYLSHYSIGPAVLLSKKRPYLTPADFKGDRVRLASPWSRAARTEDWDVTTAALTFPDIYSALERGTIDGAQSYLNYVVPFSHNEVVDHLVEPDLGQQTNIVVMNKNVYESLSEKDKQVISDLKKEWQQRNAKEDLEDNERARKLIANNSKYPVEIHSLTEEQRQMWADSIVQAEQENVERMAKYNSAAEALHQTYHEEMKKVEAEVEKDGYPWD